MPVRYYLSPIIPIIQISLFGGTPLASQTMLYRINGSRHSIFKIPA